MGKVEDIFEEAWQKVVELYKSDWIENLKDFGKDGFKMFPTNFYSEADLESQLTCALRQRFQDETFYGKTLYVKNQLTFSPEGFVFTPALSDRIKKLQDLVKDQTEKSRFKPDVVVESDTNSRDGAFLLFAELKFWPEFILKYREDVPDYYKRALEQLEVQCQTLDMAVRKGVCLSGYACVISDGYFSHDRRKAALDRLISKYKNVKFLVGGLSADEKNKALKKTN
jgi:hypothetical protein